MPNRIREFPKKWKLPLTVLFLILVCFAIFLFAHHRVEPNIGKVLDHPVRKKLTRRVRPNAPRSERAKKLNKRTDTGVAAEMGSFRCTKNTFLDEAGRILRREIDENCDGAVDFCVVQELNAYGEEVRRTRYRGCGNVPSNCIEITRNEYGEEIAYYTDENCDGHIDECHYLKRNDHGDVIEEIGDKGCDGVLAEDEWHRCSSFFYNEDGLKSREYEGKCGEEPENCLYYEYDLALGIERVKEDAKCDGTVDHCWTQIYRDDPDNPDRFMDKGCVGIWYSCTIWRDNGYSYQKFTSNEVCARKYEELVRRNRGQQ